LIPQNVALPFPFSSQRYFFFTCIDIGLVLSPIVSSKALRAAINAVFGSHQPVQRCRAHKLRNVLDYLPKDQRAQVKSLLRAPGNWDPRRAWRRSKSWPRGWITATRRPRQACLEGLEGNALPSTGWIFRPLCIAAWRQPTSSRAARRRTNPDPRVTTAERQNGSALDGLAFIRTEKRFDIIMATAI